VHCRIAAQLDEAAAELTLRTELGGDLFPAAEVFVLDEQRTAIWLAGYAPPDQGEIMRLYGCGTSLEDGSFASEARIGLTDAGHFETVQGTFIAGGELQDA
jgi:hypothetical protein